MSAKKTESSCFECCCPNRCPVSLPQTKRSPIPESDSQYELLQWFPCYFDATWPLKKLPCSNWLLRYQLKWLVSDLVAGLTVGLMVVPQALAYATIANLPHAVSYLCVFLLFPYISMIL